MSDTKLSSFSVCLLILVAVFAVVVPVNHGTDSSPTVSPTEAQEQPEILMAWRAVTRATDFFRALFMNEDVILDPIHPVYVEDTGNNTFMKIYRAENGPFFTEMVLTERLVTGNSKVRVLEYSYNGEPPIVPSENHYQTEFKEDGDGELSHAHQNLHFEGKYKLNTQYRSKDGKTKAQYQQSGEDKSDGEFHGQLSFGVITNNRDMYVVAICYDFLGTVFWPIHWPERPWPQEPLDSDGDGLYDCMEKYFYGTDPNDADSDNDQWRDGHEVFNTLTDPKVRNERYAVLISGGIDKCSNYARYWNDIQFMYAILNIYNYTDDNQAGFNPQQDHIAVLYANGLPWGVANGNAPDATCPASGWHPGDGGYHNETDGSGDQSHGLYDMKRESIQYPLGKDKGPTKGNWPVNIPIDFSATEANVQAVFNSLSNAMTPSDYLFVFVTDHGSGYYGKGGSNYYDNGRIELDSDENDNMKESDLVFDGRELPNGKKYRWDLDGDKIHDDLLRNNSGTTELLIDADNDGDGTQDAGEDWSVDYVDNDGDWMISKSDDRGNQKMHKILTQQGNTDSSIGVDELFWLWGSRLDAAGNNLIEKLYDDELNSMLSQIPAGGISIFLEQCFSGGFVSDLAGFDAIMTAATETELSWSVDGLDVLGNQASGNPTGAVGEGSFDEFVLHFVSALYLDYPGNVGYPNNYPSSPLGGVNADADGDGQVSMQEAFNYGKSEDSRAETPKSGGVNIGKMYL